MVRQVTVEEELGSVTWLSSLQKAYIDRARARQHKNEARGEADC